MGTNLELFQLRQDKDIDTNGMTSDRGHDSKDGPPRVDVCVELSRELNPLFDWVFTQRSRKNL